MYIYRYSEGQRKELKDKIAKLERENSLGSTLDSQIEMNKHVIKQLQGFLNEKKLDDNYVPVKLTAKEIQAREKREKAGEELYRIQCIKSHINCLKQELARQEHILANAEANMRN